MNNVWEFGGMKRYLKEPWNLLREIFNNFKYSWQRITKGYCDRDLWSIDDWFMKIMPDMLEQFKDTRNGSPGCLGEFYTNDDGICCNDSCHEEWDKILNEMIFLFREMNKETCSRKNIFQEEYDKIWREFEEKCGVFGEKLDKDKQKTMTRAYFPSDFPEYKEISDKYLEYDMELEKYREECKDKALELFSKYYFHLWD